MKLSVILNSYPGSIVATALAGVSTQAAPVTNWVIDDTAPPAGQTLVTSGLNTSSPVIGTTDPVFPDNADASDFHSDFPEITLTNSGDSVVLTGEVALTGINSSMRNFRFGLFDRNGSPGTTGWLGYFVANSVATSYGEIRERDAGNTGLHVSITGSTEITRTTSPGNFSTGQPFLDSVYRFELSLTRDGINYDIAASLIEFDGTAFHDSLSNNDRQPPDTESFRFNNVAFLLGGGLNTDQAAFSNIDVTFVPVPEPGSAALLGLGGVLALRRRRSAFSRLRIWMVMLASALLFGASAFAAPIVAGGNGDGITDDIFDLRQGTFVLGSSDLLACCGGSLAENVFGGTGGVEPPHTLFSDGPPIGSIDFINFQTASPIELTGYRAILADDSDDPGNPGNPNRGSSSFSLFSSPDATYGSPTNPHFHDATSLLLYRKLRNQRDSDYGHLRTGDGAVFSAGDYANDRGRTAHPRIGWSRDDRARARIARLSIAWRSCAVSPRPRAHAAGLRQLRECRADWVNYRWNGVRTTNIAF